MRNVFDVCDFRLLSLQPLFPTPPFLHKLCLVRPLEIPCAVGWRMLLGFPVTYLTASTWLWALSPTPPSLTSPWPSSSTQARSRLSNYFSPSTYPSQRMPQEVWDQSSCSAPGTWAPPCHNVPRSGPQHSLQPGHSLKWWMFCDCLVLPRFNFVRHGQLRAQQPLSCDAGRDCKTNWSNCFKIAVIKSWGFKLT